MPPGDKYLAFIEGATHLSFVDAMPFNDLPYVRDLTAIVTVAFLDAYLKGKREKLDGWSQGEKTPDCLRWTVRE